MLEQKVIFLDIDGVLAPYRLNWKISSQNVENLNYLLSVSHASIVLSSSHRINRTHDECRELLDSFGVKPLEFLGKTPDSECEPIILPETGAKLWRAGTRGNEIDSWLKQNPGIFNFVILDDDDDMDPHMDHLVQIEGEEGLQAHHVALAMEVLG